MASIKLHPISTKLKGGGGRKVYYDIPESFFKGQYSGFKKQSQEEFYDMLTCKLV